MNRTRILLILLPAVALVLLGDRWIIELVVYFILGGLLSLALGYVLCYIFRGLRYAWLLNYLFYKDLFRKWFS